jgi:hypothetical protein
MHITKQQLKDISAAMAFAHFYVIDQRPGNTEQAKKDYDAVFSGLRALAEVYTQGDEK